MLQRGAAMKNTCWPILFATAFLPLVAGAQEPASGSIEINGNAHPQEVEKLERIWLFPEDYEGKTVTLRAFLFKPENFEYFPEHDGYLFCFEPAIFGRHLNVNPYIGNPTFLSREKLNFLCTKADGQLVRQLFKESSRSLPVMADVTLGVKKRNGFYFGVVTAFTPRRARE